MGNFTWSKYDFNEIGMNMELLIKIWSVFKSVLVAITPYCNELAGAAIGYFYVYRDKVANMSVKEKLIYMIASVVIGVVLGGMLVDLLNINKHNSVLAVGGGSSLFGLALLTKGRELIENIDKNWLSDALKNIRDKFTK